MLFVMWTGSYRHAYTTQIYVNVGVYCLKIVIFVECSLSEKLVFIDVDTVDIEIHYI